MASHTKMTLWSLLLALWTAFSLALVVYVAIPDAPWSVPFWNGLMTDPTCFYHELWVILGVWLAGYLIILVTSFWYALCVFLQTMKRLP